MMGRKSISIECSLVVMFFWVSFAMMVFSPQIAYAQTTDRPAPAILPDSIFYNFKLQIENFQELITLQEDRKAELLLKHAEERDREALELERQGKMIPIDVLKRILSHKIMRAEEIIVRLENAVTVRQEVLDARDLRQEEFQARTEQERFQIQQQQRERDQRPTLIEPSLRPSLIESDVQGIPTRPEQPIEIFAVEDIKDTDQPDEIVLKLRDRLENAFTTSEITQIRARFTELRIEDDPIRRELLANALDEQVNNPIVSITCFGNVDTLRLSLAVDPVRELQDQCPILRTMSTEDLKSFVNGVSDRPSFGSTGRSCAIYPNDRGC